MKLSDDLQQSLKKIIDHFEKEDSAVRQRQIRQWKKLEYYWSGFQKIWWSEVAHNIRIGDPGQEGADDSAFYDKPVNVFRAYLEIIIAALSAQVPTLRCKPDDADNPDDVTTAKGGDKICELVYDHIDAPLLWIRALFVYCTQGMIAAYNYSESNEKYGTIPKDKYSDVEEDRQQLICPNCGDSISQQMQQQQPPNPNAPDNIDTSIQLMMDEIDEYAPGDDDEKSHDIINHAEETGKYVCLKCLVQVDPEIRKDKITVKRLTGITQEAKTRQCIKILGGLYVKVPNYAHTQADIPYLAYCYETHYSNIYAEYPELRNKQKDIDQKVSVGSASGYDVYERWGRLSTQYFGEYPISTPTVRNWWFRSSAFEVENDDDLRNQLKKKFPDGCKVVFINEVFADAENQNLDDYWTLTYNPLSEYIHFDPLGTLVTSIQEITNDMISLALQTIEHGISQTFADPSVLDFVKYGQTEATPGMIFPAKPKGGKQLSDGFFELKTANLSPEIQPFTEKIQELGQFVSGALPSLAGSQGPASNRTASQMSMSRAQSLQRLQTPWKMLTYWWKNVFAKVIPAYIKTMVEDERLVKTQNGNYINTLIKRAQLNGKIGSIELEASDQLPAGFAAIKDVVMQLLQSGNPEVLQVIGSPENLPIIRKALGLVDFVIPGEDERNKQFEEIKILLASQPMPTQDAMTGQPVEAPSVMPEKLCDNHMVEADVCRYWLNSEEGRVAKIENPAGYKNVLLHLEQHLKMIPPPPQAMNPQAKNAGVAPAAKPNTGDTSNE